jgi:hypothetical protein
MPEREDRGDRLHQRVSELLPWYVNGSLSQRERERVETHLADCRLCQEEERACRLTAGTVKSAGEAAPTPHPVQLQRVMARIDEAEREEPVRARRWNLLAPFRALVEATPRPLWGALVAQVAVIVMLVGVLVWPALQPGPKTAPAPAAVYHTLSDPDVPLGAPLGSGVRLRVMFSPKATERQIRDLLLDVRGEITGGPSPLGVYTVTMPAGGAVREILARLRSEPQVVFAEPVVGEESR